MEVKKLWECLDFVLRSSKGALAESIRDTKFVNRPDLNDHFVSKFKGYISETSDVEEYGMAYAFIRSMFGWGTDHTSEWQQTICGDECDNEWNAFLFWIYNFNEQDFTTATGRPGYEELHKAYGKLWDKSNFGCVRSVLKVISTMDYDDRIAFGEWVLADGKQKAGGKI